MPNLNKINVFYWRAWCLGTLLALGILVAAMPVQAQATLSANSLCWQDLPLIEVAEEK